MGVEEDGDQAVSGGTGKAGLARRVAVLDLFGFAFR
jgi:hypothetical protein